MQVVSCIPPSVCRKSKATERKEERKKWPIFLIQGECCNIIANQSNKKYLRILAEKLTAILRYALTINLKNKTVWTSFF